MSLQELLEIVGSFDAVTADDERCRELLSSAVLVRARIDAVEAAALSRLRELAGVDGAGVPELVVAESGRRSQREVDSLHRRSRLLDDMPAVGDALFNGEVTAEHVDVLARAVRRLEPEQRSVLTGSGDRLAELGRSLNADEFERAVRREVRGIEAASGVDRLERQRRANRLRTWSDRETGMLRGSFELDPESGLRFLGALRASVEALFHDAHGDALPSDPIERHHHLQAFVLVDLVCAAKRRAGVVLGERMVHQGQRAEMIVVVDAATLAGGIHERSRISTGSGLELAVETLGRHLCTDLLLPALVDGDGVLLELGRSRRLATVHQRRALLAMYDTCAIDGCNVPAVMCDPHHVWWWRHGGLTDLDNLLPLCSHHHHCAHEGGWRLEMDHRRNVAITFPDGRRRTDRLVGTR